jgi:hypothetical protein
VCPRGHLLHLVGWRGDAEVATAFTAAPLIETALALEVQAIASPAAMGRKEGRRWLTDGALSGWTVLSNVDGVTCLWTERARDAADPTLQPTVGH